MGRLAKGTFPSELWDWAMGQIPRIAAKYEHRFRQDIGAELAVSLLKLSHHPNQKVDDWKKYVYVSLSNRAIYLATAWSKKRSLETPLDPNVEIVAARDDLSVNLEKALELEDVQQKIPACCFELLQQLSGCGGNISLLAQKRGKHRNTIHRHLRKIRKGKCPCEIVTVRDQVQQIATTAQASVREVLRARIVLALLDGFTAIETAQQLRIARPTASRWRSRFRRYGLAGLKAGHRGRQPSLHRASLAKWLRATGNRTQLSLRQLSRRFGVSKSTVQVLLKKQMVHLSNKKTL